VIAAAFQITFCVKMHANDVFLFFKNHFWHQHIKTIQKVQTILNFSKKKFQIFWELPKEPHQKQERIELCSQTFPNYLPPQASLSWHHKHSFQSSIFSFFFFFLNSLFLFNLALLIVISLACYVTTISIEVFSSFFFIYIYNSSSFQFTFVEFIVLPSCFTLSYFYVFLKLLIYLILFYLS
jgi:hypothetical protein